MGREKMMIFKNRLPISGVKYKVFGDEEKENEKLT